MRSPPARPPGNHDGTRPLRESIAAPADFCRSKAARATRAVFIVVGRSRLRPSRVKPGAPSRLGKSFALPAGALHGEGNGPGRPGAKTWHGLSARRVLDLPATSRVDEWRLVEGGGSRALDLPGPSRVEPRARSAGTGPARPVPPPSPPTDRLGRIVRTGHPTTTAVVVGSLSDNCHKSLCPHLAYQIAMYPFGLVRHLVEAPADGRREHSGVLSPSSRLRRPRTPGGGRWARCHRGMPRPWA